jgi:hypothetical protein
MDAPSVSQQRVTDLLARWSQGDDPGEAIDLNRLATLMHAEHAWGAPGGGIQL